MLALGYILQKSNSNNKPRVKIGDESIESKCVKFFRVNIDRCFTWKKHNISVRKRVASAIYAFKFLLTSCFLKIPSAFWCSLSSHFVEWLMIGQDDCGFF